MCTEVGLLGRPHLEAPVVLVAPDLQEELLPWWVLLDGT